MQNSSNLFRYIVLKDKPAGISLAGFVVFNPPGPVIPGLGPGLRPEHLWHDHARPCSLKTPTVYTGPNGGPICAFYGGFCLLRSREWTGISSGGKNPLANLVQSANFVVNRSRLVLLGRFLNDEGSFLELRRYAMSVLGQCMAIKMVEEGKVWDSIS